MSVTRRKFLQTSGVAGGVAIASTSVAASLITKQPDLIIYNVMSDTTVVILKEQPEFDEHGFFKVAQEIFRAKVTKDNEPIHVYTDEEEVSVRIFGLYYVSLQIYNIKLNKKPTEIHVLQIEDKHYG